MLESVLPLPCFLSVCVILLLLPRLSDMILAWSIVCARVLVEAENSEVSVLRTWPTYAPLCYGFRLSIAWSTPRSCANSRTMSTFYARGLHVAAH
ncbi:uncharacterized protein B0H18DRAFT_327848 [Fomitopsis serialis]|uniref:uncharacterized protein n=1 Tax=Fomitopsis serialis TaxID=139415 RepID=UPI0020089052|nr:uncharacterized protein B0H18DRAFT_327848 [Neoantrodia serialis]KAH9936626.1 hypothetical protein B0H18DRAFT_327848 [Neoantrodia serialis]